MNEGKIVSRNLKAAVQLWRFISGYVGLARGKYIQGVQVLDDAGIGSAEKNIKAKYSYCLLLLKASLDSINSHWHQSLNRRRNFTMKSYIFALAALSTVTSAFPSWLFAPQAPPPAGTQFYSLQSKSYVPSLSHAACN
jgi:hypothetical protein